MKAHGIKEYNLSDNFPSLYWTQKLHKLPYKHRFFAVKPAIKGKLSNLSSVIYICSRTSINELWILKNSSELLQKTYSFYYPKVTSVQTFDFSSTAYIHSSSETERQDAHVGKSNISLSVNGSRRYKYLVNGDGTFFTNDETSVGSKIRALQNTGGPLSYIAR